MTMTATEQQRMRDLERRIWFLQQRLGTDYSAQIAALNARISLLESMLDYGDAGGFLDFGASWKGNAWPGQNSGYDRNSDRLFGSGQLFVRTMFDAPTILLARGDFPTDNLNIGRVDFVPCDEFGVRRYPNGSDDAGGALVCNMHTPNDGANPEDAHTHWGLQCINELESTVTKPPRTILMVTGENGGEWWGFKYNSSGAQVLATKVFG